MKYLCRFIFLFFMFIITLCVSSFCDGVSAIEIKSVDTISAVQQHSQDLLISRTSDSIEQCIQRSDGLFINNRRSDNSYDSGLNNFLLAASSQFSELLAYIYNQSFLHNKSNVLFSVSLSEIQPNAP